jgi:hypothetical protein
MQKNGEVDGFSVSPAHGHFSELGHLVDSRNATNTPAFRDMQRIAAHETGASSRVVKLPSE